MFAAGMYDPDAMFFAEGEMGYPADEIFYPEEMGYLPEGMEYVPDGMGFPPEGMGFLPDGMGYPMDNMGYTDDMVYADEMGYNNEMGYPEEIYGTTPTGPMATGENFDHEVPHTYYEDDDENSEGEGQVAPWPDLRRRNLFLKLYSWNCKSLFYAYLLSHDYKFLLFLFSHYETKTQIVPKSTKWSRFHLILYNLLFWKMIRVAQRTSFAWWLNTKKTNMVQQFVIVFPSAF